MRNHHLASAAVYGSFVRLAGMLLSFVTGLILARLLGKAGFGIYGIVISAGGLAASAALLGAPYLAVRDIAQGVADRDWGKVVMVMRGLTLPVAVIALTGAAIVAAILMLGASADGQMVAAAWWVLPFVPAYAMAVLMASFLRGLARPVRAQSVEVLFRPLLLLPPIAVPMLAGWRLDPADAVGLTTAATVISLVIGYLWVRAAVAPHHPQSRPQQRAGSLRRAIPFAAVDVLRQLEGAYPLLILGIVASNEVAGSFRVAQLGAMVVAVPYTVVGQVMSPVLANMGREPTNTFILRRAALALVGVGIGALLAAVTVGEPVIALLFGEEYGDAWVPLIVLCAVQCVNGFFGVAPFMLILAGQERAIFRIYAVTVPAAILLGFFLSSYFGATGAASAVLAGSLLSNLLAWRHALTTFGVDTSVLGRARH